MLSVFMYTVFDSSLNVMAKNELIQNRIGEKKAQNNVARENSRENYKFIWKQKTKKKKHDEKQNIGVAGIIVNFPPIFRLSERFSYRFEIEFYRIINIFLSLTGDETHWLHCIALTIRPSPINRCMSDLVYMCRHRSRLHFTGLNLEFCEWKICRHVHRTQISQNRIVSIYMLNLHIICISAYFRLTYLNDVKRIANMITNVTSKQIPIMIFFCK